MSKKKIELIFAQIDKLQESVTKQSERLTAITTDKDALTAFVEAATPYVNSCFTNINAAPKDESDNIDFSGAITVLPEGSVPTLAAGSFYKIPVPEAPATEGVYDLPNSDDDILNHSSLFYKQLLYVTDLAQCVKRAEVAKAKVEVAEEFANEMISRDLAKIATLKTSVLPSINSTYTSTKTTLGAQGFEAEGSE